MLAKEFRHAVSIEVQNRGAKYFRSGRVKIQTLLPETAMATVEGSETYHVDLELVDQTINCSCTCPYIDSHNAICKHIWATILAVDVRKFAAAALRPLQLILNDFDDDDVEDDDGEDDWTDDFEDHPPMTTRYSKSAPARRVAPSAPDWTQQLATLRLAVQSTNSFSYSYPRVRPVDRQLVYIVDGPTSERLKKLTIEIQFQERKLNGEFGKPKAQSLSQQHLESLIDPMDRRILESLHGGERLDTYGYSRDPYNQYGVSRYVLTGPILELLLPALGETGRVRFRRDVHKVDELTSLVADLESAWELVVGITPAESGRNWVLDGQLQRGDETMPLKSADLIVPGVVVWQGKFGRFKDENATLWAATLRTLGPISTPANRKDDLLKQLATMPRLPQLKLPPELQYREESIPPVPRVVVKKPATTSFYTSPSVLYAELSFDYDGEIVAHHAPGRGFYQTDQRRFVLRDGAVETSAIGELTRRGLFPSHYDRTKFELKVSQLPSLVRTLLGMGWKVEADGKLYRSAGKFVLAVSSGQDWFDLNGSADFAGNVVPFPQLLAALARGEDTIPLGDGTFGIVPEEWLKQYGLIGRIGKIEGDSVRFSKSQVGVLDALLAARPEIEFDKRFARAREELRKFTGIAAADPPAQFTGTLREYQREGLGWLRFLRKYGFGGCLADDMGLGKTVQVLALLAGKRTGPVLVVVPRSLVFNWKNEAAKFAPKLKVYDHTGASRDKTGASFAAADLVLTTYGTLRNDAAIFADVHFDTCILDESQAAKNATTETAKAVRLLNSDHRLALSGTPVENHLGELWTLFDFLNPGMLGTSTISSLGAGSVRNPDAETREFLARALKPFILRRTKGQVAKDLPEKTEQTVYCELGPMQRKLYTELRDHYRQSLLSHVDAVGLNKSKIQVLEALLRLRQAACHPGLIDEKRKKEESAKLEVLLPHLQELAEAGTKALVFSQFTSLLSIVKTRLDAEKIPYEYLDGRTRDRAARVERFQTDPDCKLFLVSLKAGGVGLNLTAAEYVFLLDPWWNPAVEAQAIDRSHRIGQTKPVFAYRLIAKDTVEEKVLALQESKRELADAILGGDGRLLSDLKREDLELLLS